jgi:cation diffusion facilitator family transporter
MTETAPAVADDHPPRAGNTSREVLRVVAIVLAVNLAVAAAKLALSFASHSATLRGDAYYTAVDALVDLLLLVFVRYAQRAPDARHPYGHAKGEAVAVAAVAVLIFAMLSDVVRHGVAALRGSTAVHYEPGYVYVLAAALLGSVALAVWELLAARRLRSSALAADGWFTVSGAVLSVVSIAALLAGRGGSALPDVAGACVAALMILVAGWRVGSEALASLMDEARLPEDAVSAVARTVEGVAGCHQVRSRGLPDSVHVDLHVQVHPWMPTIEAHHVAESVEHALMRAYPQIVEVTVHIEPLRMH